MKLQEYNPEERPRERLLSQGPAALSNGELLAVLLRSGTSGMNVLELSRTILDACDGSLINLSRMDADALRAIPGIKDSKLCTILAAFELGRRFAAEKPRKDIPLTDSRPVYDLMIPQLKGAAHEECWAIFLNKRGVPVGRERFTSGSSDSVVVDAAAIVRKAMRKGARGIILVHNHPAGDPTPSDADIRQTRSLQRMATACDLMLIDHVIVSDSSYYSFADEQLYEV